MGVAVVLFRAVLWRGSMNLWFVPLPEASAGSDTGSWGIICFLGGGGCVGSSGTCNVQICIGGTWIWRSRISAGRQSRFNLAGTPPIGESRTWSMSNNTNYPAVDGSGQPCPQVSITWSLLRGNHQTISPLDGRGWHWDLRQILGSCHTVSGQSPLRCAQSQLRCLAGYSTQQQTRTSNI